MWQNGIGQTFPNLKYSSRKKKILNSYQKNKGIKALINKNAGIREKKCI